MYISDYNHGTLLRHAIPIEKKNLPLSRTLTFTSRKQARWTGNLMLILGRGSTLAICMVQITLPYIIVYPRNNLLIEDIT